MSPPRRLLLAPALAACLLACLPRVGERVDGGAQEPPTAPSHCANGALDPGETDVDCGAECAACVAGQACAVEADCVSLDCQAQRCAASRCADGLQNGSETAVDCGGGECPACALGRACAQPRDCASGVCDGTCVAAQEACVTPFASCTTFVDLTAPTADRTLSFGSGNNRYSPRCVRIRLGQSLLFEGGSFADHGLDQACGPYPAVLPMSSGSSATFRFANAVGLYGFYCREHGTRAGTGMAGAVDVVP